MIRFRVSTWRGQVAAVRQHFHVVQNISDDIDAMDAMCQVMDMSRLIPAEYSLSLSCEVAQALLVRANNFTLKSIAH